MSHQDRTSGIDINHQSIKQAVDWLLPAMLFRGLTVRAGALWKPRMLAVAAFVWGCLEAETLNGRFELARNVAKKIFRWFAAPGRTYEGFKKVLKTWHSDLKLLLMENMHRQMREALSGQWLVAGFVVFATDGSRVALARTRSNEAAYAPSLKSKKNRKRKGGRKRSQRRGNKGTAAKRSAARKRKSTTAGSTDKKATSPQMWLTLLWHVGSGLPWSWRSGPSDSSERGHFQEMLTELPKNSLITADAGFVGYDFWNAILGAERHFVIRVGGNVKLIKRLGYAREHGHTVYLWPDKQARKKQPPLILRLVELHDGKQPVYLVTNLPKSDLSDRQAARIYGARWGIELFFRTFKQTFGRRKLRSHNADNAELELDWSLLALWGMCLVGQRELIKAGQQPRRQSPVMVIRAFQSTIRNYRVRPESPDECLWGRLRHALLDNYKRRSEKASRDYPRKKQRERTVAPKITNATKHQVLAAQQLMQSQHDFQLAA